MKDWIRLAAKLYPREWRQRYQTEFDALLDDVRPGWQVLADVMGGALKMQLMSGSLYLKLGGALAIAGAIAATGVSLGAPPRYSSSAVIQFTPTGSIPKKAADRNLARDFDALTQQITSLGSLSELIQRPAFNLYRAERARMPMPQVIERMRRRDLQLRLVQGQVPTLEISFDHPDPEKAQAVVRAMIAKYLEENIAVHRMRADISKVVWHQPPPAGVNVEVVEPPSAATKSESSLRPLWIAWGLGFGLAAGLLAVCLIRQPKLVLKAAAFAVAGCAVGAGVSALIPDRYQSVVVMRLTQSNDPKVLSGASADRDVAQWVAQTEQSVLSQASLQEIVRKAGLDGYDTQKTRQHIRIQMLGSGLGPDFNFRIEFTYPDQQKALLVVRELMHRFIEEHLRYDLDRVEADPEFRRVTEYKAGENIEVIDPPALLVTPIAPNRLLWSLAGLTAGLLACLLLRATSVPDRSPSAPAA